MANVTASMVKELREMTGAGMMECKKALVEADGDLDAAVDVLRKAGLASVAKKAGRATNEGAVVSMIAEDGKSGVLVELKCETDFVSMNEKFHAYADRIAAAALKAAPADVEALKAVDADGMTVEEVLTDAVHTIGENIQLTRYAHVGREDGAVSTYIHMGGKIGVMVEFALGDASVAANDEFKAYARDIAMQVAAAYPIAATRDQVDPKVVEHEKSIYVEQAANSGKPEKIQEKIAVGRLEKFYKENVLVEQEFVKDSDKTIKSYTDEVAKKLGTTIEIVDFVRFELGEEA